MEQARDHDLALRASEVADTVLHIPEVLCHRRIPPCPMPTDSPGATDHVVAALARRGDGASVVTRRLDGPGADPSTPSAVATASSSSRFETSLALLRACIDSVDRTRGVVVPEYLLVDNGSVQPETATLLDRLAARPDVRILPDDRPFNWAALNNAASSEATGDVLVFLNNDIEALAPGWLDALCAQSERPDIGAVGARLLYPDRRLQHCGVVIGLGGAAGHLFRRPRRGRARIPRHGGHLQRVLAVTGACLATRRAVFEGHDGFDESLGVDLERH